MQHRNLGKSGLRVPVLAFGCATFGGSGPLFSAMGQSDVDEAKKLVDICLESGVSLFDTADAYSTGKSEEILGAALKGRRDQALISTKITLPLGRGPNEGGSSRKRLISGVDAALKRLQTDYVDVLHMHAFDAFTPAEEIVSTLDQIVRDGKVRYVGVSNYAGWQLMKSLAIADHHGWARYIVHQVNYSLLARDYEWELMPLGLDQGVGAMVWSPLAWGRLTGKVRRGQAPPEGSRLASVAQYAPPVDDERLYATVDVLDAIVAETGKTHAQIALAWLLSRPTVCSIVIGARDEKQLRDNLGSIGWELTSDQIARLDAASDLMPPYPYYSYRIEKSFARLNPPPV
jgi:aryl-alcohol dehydrogenase-like predicted oxidoreductase